MRSRISGRTGRSGRQGHAQHAGFSVAAHAQQKRFPRAVSIITEINRIVASESDSANKLARVILQDFALTNKFSGWSIPFPTVNSAATSALYPKQS